MPSAPIVTWARIFPLLAAVTPRLRYLKKERRPATRGAVVGVACASLPGGFTAAGCLVGVLESFIMESSFELVPPILHREEAPRGRAAIARFLMPSAIISRIQAAAPDCPPDL